jgi:hypothetical protein
MYNLLAVRKITASEFPPVSNAGIDSTCYENVSCELNGSASYDTSPYGTIEDYNWVQISGPEVNLSSTYTGITSFAPPSTGLDETATLIFQLTVIDNDGNKSTDEIIITVENNTCNPPQEGDWVITESCILYTPAIVTGNIIVQNDALLTIPSDIELDVDLVNNYVRVKEGSGILVKEGGKLF